MSNAVKVLKYQTVVELFPDDLDAKVTELLQAGWKLHGSPYISRVLDEDNSGMYSSFHCQAMVGEEHPF